ncbi:MAG: polyvinylalcohol dehydrogenase [Planctomycetes bacterium]|nr:polyvinylalcohol dehydrogenase [Planctomycetota bacterium]
MKSSVLLTSVTTVLLVAASTALALDWPQWRGPDRTNVSKETGLLKTWPKDGPKLAWANKTMGLGFSSPSIVGDRLYMLGSRKDATYLIVLDARSGKEEWSARVGDMFTFDGNTWGDGPRSTPTIDGDRVYVLGGYGDLVCFDIPKRAEVWRKNLTKDFGGEMMTEWGFSESPLVDGELLICTPGGEKGTLAALDKKSGKLVWQSKELTNKAPYSSVVVSEAGGVRQYIQTSYTSVPEAGFISGFAAKSGKLLWTEPIFKRSSYAIAPTPVVRDNLVYATSGYGAGCHLFELSAKGSGVKAKEVYPKQLQRTVKNTHGGVVLVGDHIYGHSEVLGWVCQNFKTGEIAWKNRNKLDCTSGAITAADGKLYLYSDEGTAVLLEASTKQWQESGRFNIPEKSKTPETRRTSSAAKIWAIPVIVNGRLYLRDQELLFCYEVR